MIFIKNKYTKTYYSIISIASTRTVSKEIYTEKHHVIPKSLGGDNSKSNLSVLTAREHFICHLLLTKMLTGPAKSKMVYALSMLMNGKRIGKRSDYTINGRWYAHAKILVANATTEYWTPKRRKTRSEQVTAYYAKVDKTTEAYKNRNNSIREYQLNKVWTQKAIDNRLANCLKSAVKSKGVKNPEHSQRLKGGTQTAESNAKRSASLRGRKTSSGSLGHTWSDETKQKMSESQKNVPLWECPHCNIRVRASHFKRWHNDNCKHKTTK